MRGFLERALQRAGHEVTAFANGQEAFERLQAEPFSLLLTDIVMPRMDGIELARRASELHPDLISSDARMLMAGSQDFLKAMRA